MDLSTHFPKRTVIITVFCILSLALRAQDGEEIFKINCAACHTVGGGKLVGPDLQGIPSQRNEDWLVEWIRSSRAMVDSGDSLAVQVFHDYNKIPMPDQNLTNSEIQAVIQYIKDKSAAGGVASTADASSQKPIKSSDSATAKDILLGQHLFEGDTRLANGGASCISCHNVASDRIIPGGLLAKDLTTVYSRMGGDAGITGILNAPPFAAMTEAYKNRPLTDNEIFAITSFLRHVELESSTQTAMSTSPLLKYGFISFAIWIVIIFLVWRHRKKYTVNKRIYERQLETT